MAIVAVAHCENAVLIASLAKLAQRGSRVPSAYFVVAPGRTACPLAPPQHGGARSGLDCSARQARSVEWLAGFVESDETTVSENQLLFSMRFVGFSCRSAARASRARIALGSRLLRRRSPTKGVSAPSFSAWIHGCDAALWWVVEHVCPSDQGEYGLVRSVLCRGEGIR